MLSPTYESDGTICELPVTYQSIESTEFVTKRKTVIDRFLNIIEKHIFAREWRWCCGT